MHACRVYYRYIKFQKTKSQLQTTDKDDVTWEKNKISLFYLYGIAFILGLLFPLGFSPFHLPGLSIFSLGALYLLLPNFSATRAFTIGFYFGLGSFGLGVSWVYVSIHAYGHLHPILSAAITLIFITYLSLYPACFAYVFQRINQRILNTQALNSHLLQTMRAMTFSTLWICSEYARATVFTGFPWLILGIGQFDSPLKFYLPIIGVYGTGFIACLIACFFAHAVHSASKNRQIWMIIGVTSLCAPLTIPEIHWTNQANKPNQTTKEPIKVAIVQANLSMRDKWDESLFWSILKYYHERIQKLLNQDLIVLPESAIPLPAHYIQDILDKINEEAKTNQTSIVFGIPLEHKNKNGVTQYFNSIQAMGLGNGQYMKQHLVPFGEYIPNIFKYITNAMGIPDPSYHAGNGEQHLIKIKQNPIASLICYELAYAELLRAQLPLAQWIISISDDGWFGNSFAMPQQLQIAQVRSLQSGRYQIVSNNDGHSSILDDRGISLASLPAFTADVLKTQIIPMSGLTPWARIGDTIILNVILFAWIICLGYVWLNSKQRNVEFISTTTR